MAGEATTIPRQIEALLRAGTTTGLTDGHLLERFAGRRSAPDDAAEAAFAAIVERHGAMVLRSCRRVLGDEHAAQDAAQATFLVLARRAESIARCDSIGAWLHGVALRVANKSRVASARRRIREGRGGEIATSRMAGWTDSADDDGRWAELHEELGRLPETFRAPLVLCYLEGLTQEQAATQLRWPLGTVQSRLARGKAKLKARLIRRGVAPVAGLLAGSAASPARAAPASWIVTTVRAAIGFTTRESWAVKAGACPASAGLALEVLREMVIHKLKFALATTLVAALAVASVGALIVLAEKSSPQPLGEATRPEPVPIARPKTTPPVPAVNRTVRGVVRDEKGSPLAKVWVGGGPRPLRDIWENPRPGDIRERKEPFRDAKGAVLPPGALGKYFEVRDGRGAWHPVSPDDIRPRVGITFGGDGQALSEAEEAKTRSAFDVRVERGGWRMEAMPGVQDPVRTDPEGKFSTSFTSDGQGDAKLHFASPDYTLQATHVVKADDRADVPLEITLRPTRLVRARVIEVPKDDPKAYLSWAVSTVEVPGKPWRQWLGGLLPDPNASDPDHVKRHLEVRLPSDKYKFEFRSETLQRVVDIEVPPGDEPLDLPDLRLESLASVRMVGRPAAEIEATDLRGKPVTLADFRGKVVVLDFWATWCGPCVGAMPRLMEIKERFNDRPVVFLALHDASMGSAEAYEKAVAPLRKAHWRGKDLPFHALLDRPPLAKGARPDSRGPGEKGSGRTAETYEVSSWPSTFVIAPDGKLVGKFELDDLEGAIQSQFGLPRPRPAGVAASGRAEPFESKTNVKVKGKVVGPDGKPIAGATLEPQSVVVRQRGITTGPGGEFEFTAERILIDHFGVRVKAPGMASKMFTLPDTGEVPNPLKMGVGATVTGRVLRDGKPVAGVPMRLWQVAPRMEVFLGELEAMTDDKGRFRFPHAFADQELRVSTVTGSLKDQGAIILRPFRSGGDGSSVDLGDIEVVPGRRIAGRVVFADGRAISANTTAFAWSEHASGLLRAKVDDRGKFELIGLPEGEVSVSVLFPEGETWMPAGYRLSARNKCIDPLNPYRLVGKLDRDVDDMTILFEPGPERRSSLDPGPLSDFKEAKAGTITGVPPEAVPAK